MKQLFQKISTTTWNDFLVNSLSESFLYINHAIKQNKNITLSFFITKEDLYNNISIITTRGQILELLKKDNICILAANDLFSVQKLIGFLAEHSNNSNACKTIYMLCDFTIDLIKHSIVAELCIADIQSKGVIRIDFSKKTQLYRFQKRNSFRVKIPENFNMYANIFPVSILNKNTACILNLSANGALLLLEDNISQNVPTEQPLNINMHIPEYQKTISSLFSIRHCSNTEIRNKQMHKTGIEFLQMSFGAEQILSKLIASLQLKEKNS